MIMQALNVIGKYLSLIRKPPFHEYEEEMTSSIQKAIEDSYKNRLSEPKMVEKVTLSFRKQKKFFDGFSIFTNAVYIHGNPSMVEFDYPQNGKPGELGDLIFILSVVYGRTKWFERYTISQCKKSSNGEQWRIDNLKQLYLLSRFPVFRGTPGSLIPRGYYILHNYTRCLGSYVLFRPLEEFYFLSAPLLELLLSDRRVIHENDLAKATWLAFCFLPSPPRFSCWSFPFLPFYPCGEKLLKRCFELAMLERSCLRPDCCGCVLGNVHLATSVFMFVDAYLRGCVGELVYALGVINEPALKFLHELLLAVKSKAEKIKKTLPELAEDMLRLVNDFFSYPYDDFEAPSRPSADFRVEGGGIGIVHTVIDLGGGPE